MNVSTLKLNTTALTLRSKDTQPSLLKKLGDIYEEHAKLVFLIDISSSMEARMCSKNEVAKYIWSDEKLAEIRTKATAVFSLYNLEMEAQGYSPSIPTWSNDYAILQMRENFVGPSGEAMFSPSDDELKERVVKYELTSIFQVPVDFAKYNEAPLTRMAVVKKLARREIRKRFDDNPNSDVAVIKFNTAGTVLFNKGTINDVDAAIDQLDSHGGTNILEALRTGMTACRVAPSQIGLHHFIVVSDGEDSVHALVDDDSGWIRNLKASGVVLDYIHIGHAASVNSDMATACKATGGNFVCVSTEDEMEEKFVEAVKRKLLPPAE